MHVKLLTWNGDVDVHEAWCKVNEGRPAFEEAGMQNFSAAVKELATKEELVELHSAFDPHPDGSLGQVLGKIARIGDRDDLHAQVHKSIANQKRDRIKSFLLGMLANQQMWIEAQVQNSHTLFTCFVGPEQKADCALMHSCH